MQITEKHKKQIIGGVIGLLTIMAVNFLIPKSSFDKELLEACKEVNQICPFMVDSETRLDNTMVLPNKTFAYNYTLINIGLDDMNTDEFRNSLVPQLVELIATSEDMKIMRDNNTIFNYNYRDKDRKEICKIVITPDMYHRK